MSGYRLLRAEDALWRPSNQMGVSNTDIGRQLDSDVFGVRLWRLAPGQASTRHRHMQQVELYVLLEGTGRVRIGEDVLTISPLSALEVQAREVRQLFNDTHEDAMWLVVGTPIELADTRRMTPEQLARAYPDGPRALPPELDA